MAASRLYISQLFDGVVELARQAVQSGKFSERGLARKANISQPHLHNVLKGIRTLSPDASDRLMQALDRTIVQMLWADLPENMSEIREVPLLRYGIGPGSEPWFTEFRGYLPFPLALVEGLEDPVAGYLSPDLALPSEFRANDLALMDLNRVRRTLPDSSSCWVVAENSGLRVRYVRRAHGGLEVGSDLQIPAARDWHPISFHGRDILDIVRARIVWIGREMETPHGRSAWSSRSGD